MNKPIFENKIQANTISANTWHLLYCIGVSICLWLSFSPIFRFYSQHQWGNDPSYGGVYSFGPLILVASVIMVWRLRNHLTFSRGIGYPAWIAHAIFAFGIGIKILGEMEGFNFLRGISLIPILIGTVAVLYPKKTVRVFLFPILYLGFAVPMPPFLLAEITNPLLEANTWMVEKAMSLVGIEFLLSGNTFLVTDLNTRSVHAIQLVDGCSGIHSIFALFAVVCLYLYWSGASLLRSSAMLAAALPLAAIGNVSRVLATIQITRSFGPGPGQTFFHEYSGFLVFTLTLLCLFALERKR